MKRNIAYPSCRLRAVLTWVIVVSFGMLGLGEPGFARQNRGAGDGEIRVLPVQGTVYMLVGAGGNIAVSVGPDGAILVDAGSEAMAEEVVAAVRQIVRAVEGLPRPNQICVGCPTLTNKGNSPYFAAITTSPAPPKPVRYVINTSVLPDHVGGNETISRIGGATFQGGNLDGLLSADVQEGAVVAAHENVLFRMPDVMPEASFYAMPSEIYGGNAGQGPFRAYYKFYRFFNGDAIQLYHAPRAITDGDSIVHFRYSDVIVTGDVFVTTNYPMIDLEKGGSVQGVLDGLNHILDLAVTENNMQGGTMIIPGHGRLSDASDVARYRDVVTIIRDRISDMIRRDMSVEQVKAANPTLDFDRRYATDYWTADMFVEAVYRDLSQQ
jgi:cyclase